MKTPSSNPAPHFCVLNINYICDKKGQLKKIFENFFRFKPILLDSIAAQLKKPMVLIKRIRILGF